MLLLLIYIIGIIIFAIILLNYLLKNLNVILLGNVFEIAFISLFSWFGIIIWYFIILMDKLPNIKYTKVIYRKPSKNKSNE